MSISTLNDLVERFHNGYWCDNKSQGSIRNALRNALMDYKKGQLPVVDKSKMEYFFEDGIVKQYDSILLDESE